MLSFSTLVRTVRAIPLALNHAGRQPARSAAWLLIVAAGLGLQACSSVINPGIDYQSARTRAEPLDVPPSLVAPDRNDRFDVPGVSGQTLSEYEKEQRANGVRPAGTGVLAQVPGVTVERDGAQTWLHVNLPPEEVWPVVHEFWQENGFIFSTDAPIIGILETDWAENRAKVPNDYLRNILGKVFDSLYSLGERDRFRTRLERASDGGTDIFVTHRGLVEVVASVEDDEQTKWQDRPADPSLEAEFLKRLMLRFGETDPGALAQVAPAAGTNKQGNATAAAANQVAQIIETPAGKRLQIGEGFDRAWRNVGLALDRTGFTVEDRDRSAGTYYVRYIDSENPEQKRPGAIARLFGAEEPEPALQKYRILVTEKAGQSEVAVLPPDDKTVFSPESAATSGRMLGLIKEQLLR